MTQPAVHEVPGRSWQTGIGDAGTVLKIGTPQRGADGAPESARMGERETAPPDLERVLGGTLDSLTTELNHRGWSGLDSIMIRRNRNGRGQKLSSIEALPLPSGRWLESPIKHAQGRQGGCGPGTARLRVIIMIYAGRANRERRRGRCMFNRLF
jgi:hypothetical protein